MIQCAVSTNVEDVYGAMTTGHSGGAEKLPTDTIPWARAVSIPDIENRMVQGVIGVDCEDVNLAVYTFGSDRVFRPCPKHRHPTSPLGIRVTFRLVFPPGPMVHAENKSVHMFGYHRDHVGG